MIIHVDGSVTSDEYEYRSFYWKYPCCKTCLVNSMCLGRPITKIHIKNPCREWKSLFDVETIDALDKFRQWFGKED